MNASVLKKEIDTAIKDYCRTRKTLIALGEEYHQLIGGNDNMIGRIGEYIAIRFLEKTKKQHPVIIQPSNNPGFDLKDGKTLTQVKVLTGENRTGKGMRLAEGWTQFILIDLDLNTLKAKIGFITRKQFEGKALKDNPGWSRTPVVKRSMLGEKGLFQYGEKYDDFEFLK